MVIHYDGTVVTQRKKYEGDEITKTYVISKDGDEEKTGEDLPSNEGEGWGDRSRI